MSWWKRAISNESVKAKLEGLWSDASRDKAKAALLYRYIDALPQAHEMIKKYLESNSATSWAYMYIDDVQKGIIEMPGWLERIVIDIIPNMDPNENNWSINKLSNRIGIEKLDPALAEHLRSKGKLDQRWFIDREHMRRPVHEILPNVHRVIVGALDRNMTPDTGLSGELARDLDAGRASPEMKNVLGKLMARTGSPPPWAYNWVEENLAGKRNDLPPDAMGEWHRGILSRLRSHSYISPASMPWFVQHMMGEDDERLWASVMQIILSPAISIKTSQMLGDMMGPAIVAARKRGVISSRIDDHVARIMVDYLDSKWSTGRDKTPPAPWAVQYMKIDGMMEKVIEESQRIPEARRFPTYYMHEKIEQRMSRYSSGSEATR
jgi:hypothetical protein